MKPGRKLNALIAMRVLGLHEEAGWWKNDADEIKHPACVGCMGESTWSPSTDIAAAWQVVEKLANIGYIVNICLGPNIDSWQHASIQTVGIAAANPKSMDTVAETVPLAICLAALKAFDVEVEDETR